MKRITLYGGSFNPPTCAHRVNVEAALDRFDEVVVIPRGCGSDKPTTYDISPRHRAVMVDLAFRDLPRVRVVHSDLEREVFTRTWELDELYRPEGEVWHLVGTDLIRTADGRCPIRDEWHRGEELWNSCRFAVTFRAGSPCADEHLPPRHQLMPSGPSTASSEVRDRVFKRLPYEDMVLPEIAAYIERWGLYRGRPPVSKSPFRPERLLPKVVADPENPEAVELAQRVERARGDGPPNCVLVLGGDGMFMRSIRDDWKLRLPFYGLNLGHVGHFMNELGQGQDPLDFLKRQDLVIRQSPMLNVEWEDEAGRRHVELGVNDAWLRNAAGQSAWIRLAVDGKERIANVSGDGVLVASALGSTGYAWNLGATPLFDQPGLIVAGIVPNRFLNWTPVHEPVDAVVELTALDIAKRPVEAFIDSVPKGRARSMTVRASRTAAVELVFTPEDDLDRKRERYQYPSKK